jgi:glycosyltransferase involved in cell wall biosynthesis
MNRDVSVSPASFVSIVIVNYNQGRFLSSAIQSILRQTDTEFHLLIWDDGSSDRSVEIAQAFAAQDPRIKVVSAPHQGLGAARLQAIAQTLAQTKKPLLAMGMRTMC